MMLHFVHIIEKEKKRKGFGSNPNTVR